MNALVSAGDIGMGIFNAFKQGQLERRDVEQRNALAAYATNPTREGLAGIAQYNPEFVLGEQGRYAQQDAQRAQKQQADMGTMRQLLRRAGASPEGWQQAVGAAQQMGIDVSGIPQQYDPKWVEQQLFIMDALETPKGQEALSTAGKIAADMGFQPGTPQYNAKVTEIWTADQLKTIAVQPGGSVVGYNTATGQSTPIVQPGGPSQSRQVGGQTYWQGPDGQWYDNEREAMGGSGGNATGGF